MVEKEAELTRLEAQALQPDFWANVAHAQGIMRKTAELKGEIALWRGLESKAKELLALVDLALVEGDTSMEAELTAETDALAARLQELEFQVLLSGDYDACNAIVAIHAGAGGTESQDWAEMLLRMYLRWAERRGYQTEVLDVSPGEEAGVKSVTLGITGSHGYGYLKSERGVHRLVRLSPFDASHSRHTSFALVEVLPEAEEGVDVSINPDDLRIDIFRSSGAGGQNVQKVSTAVRLTHLPTGIVVSCQNERSQFQNRETAMKILRARLMELELERKAEEKVRLKGEHIAAGWGNQIRSYVLHPYKMVKDHRSGYETSDSASVLDGDLDAFIWAYLKSNIGAR